MELSNFSSLIEVAVTLNIAFVAVEYVKTYTRVLCTQVFKFNDFIKDLFDKIERSLVDEETLEHIQPNVIDGKSTTNAIEKVKREREKIQKDINSNKERLTLRVENVCEINNISSVSLWMFFYGLLALILIGFDMVCPIIQTFWSALFLFSVLYSVAGWLVDSKSKCLLCDFSSLRHAIIWFAIVVATSIIAAAISFKCTKLVLIIEYCWDVTLFVSLLFMYSNFIAAVLKVWQKAKAIKQEIKDTVSEIHDKSSKLQEEVNKLISVNEICSQLEV